MNRSVLLVLSLLLGLTMGLNVVVAQAYLLSVAEPIFAVAVGIGVSLVFSMVLAGVGRLQVRFASLAAVMLLVLGVGLLLLRQLPWAVPQAVGWLLLASLGMALSRWVGDELVIRYLNPAVARSYLTYVITVAEIGTFAGVTVLRGAGLMRWDPLLLVDAVVVGHVLAAAVIVLHFARASNVEVLLEGNSWEEMGTPPWPKAVITATVLLGIVLGAFRVGQDYLLKLGLHDTLPSYAELGDVIAGYTMLGSGCIAVGGLLWGYVVRRRRVSPTHILLLYVGGLLLAAMIVAVMPTLASLVALEVMRRAGSKTLFSPAIQMLRASFIRPVRATLRYAFDVAHFVVPTIPLLALLLWLHDLPVALRESFLLGLVLASLVAAGGAVLLLSRRYADAMHAHAMSDHTPSAVLATEAMSFLGRRGLGDPILRLLEQDPQALLRKTVVLDTGNHGDVKVSGARRVQQVKDDTNEVHVAVLDAMAAAQQQQMLSGIIRAVRTTSVSPGVRVRVNAPSVAAVYGKKAIPYLLAGLDDEDPRVVADTLEALASFKDPSLTPHVQRFVDCQAVRVRANALMALAQCRATRSVYQEHIGLMLASGDVNSVVAALYVIGRLGDGYFLPQLLALSERHPLPQGRAVVRGLAWALTRLGHQQGYAFFGALFVDAGGDEASDAGAWRHVMHFFSQLDGHRRFEVLRYLAQRTDAPKQERLAAVFTQIAASDYVFEHELAYFETLRQRYAATRQKSKARISGSI